MSHAHMSVLDETGYKVVNSLLSAVSSTFSAREARIVVTQENDVVLVASSLFPSRPDTNARSDGDATISTDIARDGRLFGKLQLIGPSSGVTEAQLKPFANTLAEMLAAYDRSPKANELADENATRRELSALQRNAAAEHFQNEFLEKVVESFPGILIVVGPPPLFKLEYSNSRAAFLLPEPLRMIGTSLAPFISSLSLSGPSTDSRSVLDLLAEVHSSRMPISYEMYETRDSSGRALYWNWSIFPLAQNVVGGHGSTLVIANDISNLVIERQRALKATEEVKKRADELEATFNQMVDGVAIFSTEGERVRMNEAAERFLGRGITDTRDGKLPQFGQEYEFFTQSGERYEPSQRPGARAARGETIAGEQLIVRWRDGEEAILNISAAPLYDRDGIVTGSVSVFHDITREKLVERMKDEFLSVVSHELRTPLSAVTGYSDLMLRGVHGPLTDRQARALTAIQANAGRLLHLINDVLDVSKLDAGSVPVEIGPVNMHAVITRMMASVVVPAKEAGLDISNLVPRDLWVQGDARRLEQVLENLVSNAIKFTARGGHITISATLSTLRSDSPAMLKAITRLMTLERTSAESAIISIEDTGGGLTDHQIERIWGRFYQADGSAKRKSGGTGLGLTIVKGLLDLLGGQVWAESAGPSLGSTFSFSLPLIGSESPVTVDDQSIVERAGFASKAKKRRKSKGLVLVAEDDADQREIMCEMLEFEGFEVALAIDGEEARDLTFRLHPKAVALDVLLPRMDGWAVLREIKSNPETKDIPVLIFSVIDHRAYGKTMGADEYLIKPVESKALREAIKRMVAKS